MQKGEVHKFPEHNCCAAAEEKHTILQIHKHILSFKPGQAVTSQRTMLIVYRQLENEKDKLFQHR